MSGVIQLSEQSQWSAARWLFDWVIEYIAITIEVEDKDTADELREIVNNNLGHLAIAHFPKQQRQQILWILATKLPSTAKKQLQLEPGFDRDSVLDRLHDLSNLAQVEYD